jgi:ABC-type lipoprotein export system ATPase subunit
MVSHDHRVLQYADRIVWLEDGHIEEREPQSMAGAGTPPQLSVR